jgi:hypothetical protein
MRQRLQVVKHEQPRQIAEPRVGYLQARSVDLFRFHDDFQRVRGQLNDWLIQRHFNSVRRSFQRIQCDQGHDTREVANDHGLVDEQVDVRQVYSIQLRGL